MADVTAAGLPAPGTGPALGAVRVTAVDGDGAPVVVGPDGPRPPRGATIVLGVPERADGTGRTRREVVVDGWRFEVELEPEARARLRERAGRAAASAVHDGRIDVRAVIPGRVLSVAVVAGDRVGAGDRLLVVEAMKMQNDVRAPRAGTIGRVAVAAGQTIELRDILVELE
jgi:biotin carboxyl carrier protein